MSWKPEVEVEGKYQSNSLVFATKEEAERYAADLYRRWILTTGHRAVEVDDQENPVNYRIDENNNLIRLEDLKNGNKEESK